MTRIAMALFLAMPWSGAAADRISEMSRTERCVYTARLAVAGYHHYLQGRSRADLRIHWKGDETPNEIEFVMRVIDEAYARAQADGKAVTAGHMSEQDFGDEVYAACMADRQ
jgi:hypothetical protein